MKRPLFILIIGAMAVAGRAAAQNDTAAKGSLAKAAHLKPAIPPALTRELADVYNAKDGIEKEEAYLKLVSRFPPEPSGANEKMYDYARVAIALAFAREDNVPKIIQYVSLLSDPATRGETMDRVANTLIAGGHLAEAEPLLKTMLDKAQQMAAMHRGDEKEKDSRAAYVYWCDRYASLLYKEKNYPAALTYARPAHDSAGETWAEINDHYAGILIALGRDEEALRIIDETVKAGVVTDNMQRELETLYVKVRGKEGYEAYMAEVDRQLSAWAAARLKEKMVDEVAPGFTLRDLEGKKVSLADYKGKVVVIDFWATWCGPCKASFPAMQMAVDKYKDNPDVQFLFIHTWDQESDAAREARTYLKDMKYTFRVLMDWREGATRISPVLASFGAQGIPARYVIDKNGHIRFKHTGFNQGQEETEVVKDLSAMILLAQKS